MKKYTILTFNFNNYEIFREPEIIDEECDYVYVTDNKNYKSNIWKIKVLDSTFDDKTPYYKSFYVRYHPFEFVSTDICIIIDASMKIKKSFNSIINDFNKDNYDISLLLMPFHNNMPYEEIKIWCTKLKRLNKEQADLLFNFYKIYKMETYRGGIDAGFKIVKNTNIINDLHKFVWEHILFLKGNSDVCRLDQVILSLLFYKFFNNLKVMLMSRRFIQSDYLAYCQHGTNNENYFYNIDYNNQYFLNKPANFYF